jgi:hypothetical protein
MDLHDVRCTLLVVGTLAGIKPAAALTFSQTAHQGPALAVFNGKLYIAVTGGPGWLLSRAICTSPGSAVTIKSTSCIHRTAPSVLAFDSSGVRGCIGFIRPVSVVFTTRRVEVGGAGGPTLGCPVSTLNQNEEPYTTGVGLGLNGTDVYVAWVGTHNANLIHIWRYTTFGAGSTFVGETTTTQTTFTNPSITGFNGHTFYAWSGTDNPRHVNVAQLN